VTLASAAALCGLVAAPAAASRCATGPQRTQPRCRVATRGATERTTPPLTAYSLFRPDWPLNVNGANGARRWPIRNSLGQVFAWIEQRWDTRAHGINKTTAWILYEPDGRTVFDSRSLASRAVRDSPHSPYLAIQGYACMLDARYRGDPMVVLLHGDYGRGGRYIGVRGFLDAQAIPARRGALLNTGASQYKSLRAKSWPQVLAAVLPGDAVMVKGSLGSRMVPIVKALQSRYRQRATAPVQGPATQASATQASTTEASTMNG